MAETEIPLSGGNTSSVVRVGNTVRRRMGPFQRSVHLFLKHLEVQGVPAPRFLGVDAQGREILGFIDGETGIPAGCWDNDKALVASARLLRRIHDASVGLVQAGDHKWAYQHPDRAACEVIGHNDFAPYNFVFRDGVPIAVIDFDLCGPAPRTRDLAYLAYWMVPLSFGTQDLAPHALRQLQLGVPRLRLLCQAYGDIDPLNVLSQVAPRLKQMGDLEFARHMLGSRAAERLQAEGHLTHWQSEFEAFEAKIPEILEAMSVF